MKDRRLPRLDWRKRMRRSHWARDYSRTGLDTVSDGRPAVRSVINTDPALLAIALGTFLEGVAVGVAQELVLRKQIARLASMVLDDSHGNRRGACVAAWTGSRNGRSCGGSSSVAADGYGRTRWRGPWDCQ